jgi:hypothetical protein
MKKKTFEAKLHAGHQEDAVELPFDPAETWSVVPGRLWRGRRGHHVMATLNGISFPGFVVSRQRKWFLLVDEDIKQAAGVVAGDIVAITLSPTGSVAS